VEAGREGGGERKSKPILTKQIALKRAAGAAAAAVCITRMDDSKKNHYLLQCGRKLVLSFKGCQTEETCPKHTYATQIQLFRHARFFWEL
jgi:hypothetical protein